MQKKHSKPDWTPEDAGEEFAISVIPGVDESNISKKKKNKAKQKNSDLDKQIIEYNLAALAKGITLVESNSKKHLENAQILIKKLLPYTGKSIRIGISGAPGVGKSTFIESFGLRLCNMGYKVAVLAIDPSSTKSKGSIMGDKTRMEKLSREKNAFIRPSPSGGNLGGVSRKTRESILLCEAAGYDVIIVETVGVGQNEVTVRSMVDFYMLMILPGGGDELQGIKKGIVELADLLVINKADLNKHNAEVTKQSYSDALHYLQPATVGWTTDVKLISALKEEGIENIWDIINKFKQITSDNKMFLERRNNQKLEWVYSMIEETLLSRFYSNPDIQSIVPKIEQEVLEGKITPTNAFNKLLKQAGY